MTERFIGLVNQNGETHILRSDTTDGMKRLLHKFIPDYEDIEVFRIKPLLPRHTKKLEEIKLRK